MSTSQRKSLEPWLLDEVDFRGYQIDGVRFLIRNRHAIMGDDMGLGKSLQAITTFATDAKMGWAGNGTMLVVCPVTLKDNWANEFKKFTRIPAVVLGQRLNSRGRTVKTNWNERVQQIVEFALDSGPRALIVNYEQVVNHIDELNACGIHFAVFDEVHYLGNFDSKRTGACMMIKATRKLPMTGTLMTNQVNNLWAPLKMVDRNNTPDYHTFMNKYAVYGGFKNSVIGVKNKDELHEVLGRVMIRRLKTDVSDLPDVQKIPVYVRLTEQQQKLYDEVVNDFQLTSSFDPDNPEEIDNHLTKALRLKQICGSTHPFLEEDHSNKLDDAVARATELVGNGHKVVVFTQFRETLELFVQRMARVRKGSIPIWQLHGGIPVQDRFATVEAWSKHSEAGIIACMIQVAAVGLNMVAARHGIFLDETYIPTTNRQAIDRMHRIGQGTDHPVTIWTYITIGTVEERIVEICEQKEMIFDEVVTEAFYRKKLVQGLISGTSNGQQLALE